MMKTAPLFVSLLAAGCLGSEVDDAPIQDGVVGDSKADTSQEVSLRARGKLRISFKNVQEAAVRVRALTTADLPGNLKVKAFYDDSCDGVLGRNAAADQEISNRNPTLDIVTPESRSFCLVVENPNSSAATFRLNVSNAQSEGTTQACQNEIDKDVMSKAIELSDTASLIDQRLAYGSEDTYGDVVLVEVSDETEPTHYVVITSRLHDDVVDAEVCSLPFVAQINEGVLPDLGALEPTGPDSVCKERIEEAVLALATEINETAQVTGLAPVYGGDDSLSSVVLVRVSDETEPSDYAVVFETEDCVIEHVENVASGLLPDVPGL